jgi:ABC-2 type transport system permease protein
MAAHAAILSPLFILMPSARIIQNSLSYPFYLLGGVVVPVSLLPQWIQPLSRFVFLSWASDLLRDSLDPGPLDATASRLSALVALGVAAQVLGVVLLRRVLVQVRTTGTLSRSI